MSKTVEEHGWTPVPRSLDKVLESRSDPKQPAAIELEEIPLPESPLVRTITKYARENLPKETFNHSMRVYYYGRAITIQHFPSWRYSPETWFLACMFHDIGTTEHNMNRTRLSFEFQGGFEALRVLTQNGAPQSQAEVVAETVIRHQDVGDTGNLALLTSIAHFATLLDNTGKFAELVHPDTIRNVVAAWPRLGWTGCFASVVRKEKSSKPWSHTTKIEDFAELVEANEVMRPYD